MRSTLNLIGQRFGRLTVIGRGPNYEAPDNHTVISTWICQCDCGKTTRVMRHNLRSGATKSCGCYRHDFLVARWERSRLCPNI